MRETTSQPMNLGPQETVYQDHVRRIYRKVAEFEGFSKQYLVSDEGERAAGPVTSGSYVLFARQYRLLIDNVSLEIPAEGLMLEKLRKRRQFANVTKKPGWNVRNLEAYNRIIPVWM